MIDNDIFQTTKLHTLDLAIAMKFGNEDDADAIRDKMDSLWIQLSRPQQIELEQYSSDLYDDKFLENEIRKAGLK